MKNTILLAAICIAIGFSAAWIAKPSTSDEEANSNEPSVQTNNKLSRPSDSLTSSEKRKRRSRATNSREMNSDEMTPYSVTPVGSGFEFNETTTKEIEQHREREQKMLRDQLKKKSDIKIEAMVAEIGLDANQEKALRAYFDKQLDFLSSSNPIELACDPEAMKNMAATMRGDDLAEVMGEHLSDEQKEALDAMQQRKKKNKIEGLAMKDLSKIQIALDLNDEQRDEVYNILIEDAESQLENQSDTNIVMNGMMNNMGMGGMAMGMGMSGMDMEGMDMGGVLMIDSTKNGGEIDQANIMAQIRKDRTKKINAKVDRLAPVLNDNQIKRYRHQLENNSGIFNFMMQDMGSQADQ